MSDQPNSPRSLVLYEGEPLIGLMLEEDGQEVCRFFASEEDARRFVSAESLQRALDLIGAWSDLDWDEMEAELDRIRHESPPSPPISL